MKYFLIAAALFFSVTTLAQTSVTTLRFEFYIKNTDGAKIVICKLFDKTDLLTNDTIAFIKMQFRDDDKSGNNGYIILSGQKEVDDFAGCLTTVLTAFIIHHIRRKKLKKLSGKYLKKILCHLMNLKNIRLQ